MLLAGPNAMLRGKLTEKVKYRPTAAIEPLLPAGTDALDDLPEVRPGVAAYDLVRSEPTSEELAAYGAKIKQAHGCGLCDVAGEAGHACRARHVHVRSKSVCVTVVNRPYSLYVKASNYKRVQFRFHCAIAKAVNHAFNAGPTSPRKRFWPSGVSAIAAPSQHADPRDSAAHLSAPGYGRARRRGARRGGSFRRNHDKFARCRSGSKAATWQPSGCWGAVETRRKETRA